MHSSVVFGSISISRMLASMSSICSRWKSMSFSAVSRSTSVPWPGTSQSKSTARSDSSDVATMSGSIA